MLEQIFFCYILIFPTNGQLGTIFPIVPNYKNLKGSIPHPPSVRPCVHVIKGILESIRKIDYFLRESINIWFFDTGNQITDGALQSTRTQTNLNFRPCARIKENKYLFRI